MTTQQHEGELTDHPNTLNALGICPEICRGCRHRHLSVSESARQKQSWLARRLSPWADRIETIHLVDANRRLGYRRKVNLHARYTPSGWQFGLMQRDKSVLAIPECPVHDPAINRLMQVLRERLPDDASFPLRYVSVAEKQIVLVVKAQHDPRFEDLARTLCTYLETSTFEGLWLHCNPATGKRVYAKRDWHLCWGRERSMMSSGLLYGPAAFSQVLPELHQHSLDRSQHYLAIGPGDIVIDLYCGIGVSVARWLEAGARVIGVDSGREAMACARLNCPDAQLFLGNCADRLPQLNGSLAGMSGSERKKLYVNPPRTGLESQVLAWICNDYKPDRIAYLSCSAGTLARDLDYIERNGYRIEAIIPYDFFPHTHHVETLALLSQTGLARCILC